MRVQFFWVGWSVGFSGCMVLRESGIDYGQVLGQFWEPLAVIKKCESRKGFTKLDCRIIILYIHMMCNLFHFFSYNV